MRSAIGLLGIAVFAAAACGDDGGSSTADAAPVDAAIPDPDAAVCTAIGFDTGTAIAAGASDDLWDTGGPGAWVANRSGQPAPGEIVYVEAYRDTFAGMVVRYDGFEDWVDECTLCVFFGTGCATYEIGVTGDNPTAPVQCDKLFMLDYGDVTLSAFDTTPTAGSLAGTVAPASGESTVRLVEVYREGDPSSPTGYGQRVDNGSCVEMSSLTFSGSWGQPVDAGVPDATQTDASAFDAQ